MYMYSDILHVQCTLYTCTSISRTIQTCILYMDICMCYTCAVPFQMEYVKEVNECGRVARVYSYFQRRLQQQ